MSDTEESLNSSIAALRSNPPGIRNNNPGNIDYHPEIKWQGLAVPPNAGRFCRFKAPVWGIRALARNLITYQDKRGLNTVACIIKRWAPPSENNTAKYVHDVCEWTRLRPDEPLDLHTHAHLRPLVEAIIKKENGIQPYDGAVIDKALGMAGVETPVRPLFATRTVKGGAIALAGLAGTEGSKSLGDVISEARDQLWAFSYLEIVNYALFALTVAGIAWMLWARWDDRRRGLR